MKLGNFIIDFDHSYHTPGYKGKTTCIVGINDMYVVGESFCSFNDQFNKKIGRKIALTRALNNSNLPKEEKTLIWNDYLKQTKH